jgi:hypothetical protein
MAGNQTKNKLAGCEERTGEGHRRVAPDHLVAERQVVVLRLPQCHRHGRRWRAQPSLRLVRARLVRTAHLRARYGYGDHKQNELFFLLSNGIYAGALASPCWWCRG